MVTFISTVSGKRFYFDYPAENKIEIEDIAHALGNLCRFTGQCRVFYSVAEHSELLSRIVPPEHALVGLLHDATEAYCADLASPLKRLLPDYRAMERRIWLAVAKTFDIDPELPKAVKEADMAMLKLEITHLLPSHCLNELDLPGPTADINMHYWSPPSAGFFFMERFRELTR